MEKLIFIMSICSAIANLFLMNAEITGRPHFIVKMFIKFIALLGVVTPILYWLKLLQVI